MSLESYRRVVPSFWTDPDVRTPLSPADKLLLLYFVTSPHSNMAGLYSCPLVYVARETGLAEAEISRAIAGSLAGFLAYDPATEEVLVYAMAKHQIGAELKSTDHRFKAMQKMVRAAHSPNLVRAFLERYADWNLGIPLPDRREEAPSKPLRSPLQAPSKGGSTPPAKHDIAWHDKAVISAEPPAEPEPVPKTTWLTPFVVLWEASRGDAPVTRFARPFRKLVRRYGARQVRAAWDGYLRERKGKDFCTVEDFAANYLVHRNQHALAANEVGDMVPMPDEPEVAA